MKLLFYRYGSICEPDYIYAFEQVGMEVVTIDVEITKKEVLPSETMNLVAEALKGGDIAFVFTINFYPAISEVCNRFKIRYLCQTVDSPVFELYSESIKNEWNRVFVFDGEQFAELAPLNPGNVFYLGLSANTDRYDKAIAEASDADRKKFSADVSFVGSLYSEKNPYVDYEPSDEYLTGYLESLMFAQMKVYGLHFLEAVIPDDIVKRFISHVRNFYRPPESIHIDEKRVMVRNYLDMQISVMERMEVMKRLGEKYKVRLFTGSNTKGLPVEDCGLVKTHTEMPIVFHESKINLNITTKGIRQGLPLRIFDVLGCGGFLITNYQVELEEFFVPDEDLVVYTDMDDLVAKVGYYLEHDDERERIRANGYKKVKECYSPIARVAQMIEAAF